MRRLTLSLLALTLAAAPLAAQAPANAELDLVDELRTLNATLLEIKELLESQTETQGLDLLMKRMELNSTQMATLETRLRSSRTERQSVEDDRVRLTDEATFIETQIESGSMDEGSQAEAYRERLADQMARLDGRLQEVDNEIVELENRIAAKRRDLEEWQSYIDRRLSGL